MKTNKRVRNLLNAKKVLSQTGRILLAFFATLMLYLLFFVGVRFINKTAHLSFSANDIKEIPELRTDGMMACFVDDYYFNAAKWSFCGDIMLKSRLAGDLEVLLPDGKWLPVSEILLQSEKESMHELYVPQINFLGRVDYEITTGSTMADSGLINYESVLTYLNHASDDFSYNITAPVMIIDIYWESEENADSDYLEWSVDDTTVTLSAKNATGAFENISSKKFRVRTISSHDNKVGGYWQIASISAFCQHNDGRVSFSFSPFSEAMSDEAGTTILKFSYLTSLKATLSGNISFRYAIDSKDYSLHNEQLLFKVDEQTISDDISKVTSYGYIDLDYDNGTANLGTQTLSYPHFSIDTTVDHEAKKRISSCEFDAQVVDAEINSISLFPNFTAFVSENWFSASIIGIVVSVCQFFILKKNDDEQGKQTKRVSKKKRK